MINGMNFYPQAVVLKGKVYVGGGNTSESDVNQNTVVSCYDIERDQWSAMPRYFDMFFAT